MIRKIADNIYSPLGFTTAENYANVKAGKSRLQCYEGVMGLPQSFTASLFDWQEVEMLEGYTRFETIAIQSARRALAQTDIDPMSSEVVFVISTTKGNVELLEEGHQTYLGEAASRIATYFGNTNSPLVVSNACISGLSAQITAARLLESGVYETAVVIGCDVQSRFIISGFQSLMALSPMACRPFDIERVGLNLGEAAATIIYNKVDHIELDEWQAVSGAVRNDAHHISEEEFWEAFPTVQWHMDEPSADPSAVALYFVDKLAARKVKAVLSGEGADELFGGYRIYQVPFANEHVGKVPRPLLRAGSKVLRAVGKRGANYLERASEQVEDWYYTNANGVAFSPDERDHLLSPELRKCVADTPSPQQLTAPHYAEVAGLDETARMQHVDLAFWLAGDILLKTDKMAMAHSLESRVPFLDREVFAVAASIPTSQKVDERQTKRALRQAAERAIPSDWAQKEKLGFPVPLASWLREDRYYELVQDAFTSEAAERFFDSSELVRMLERHREGADLSRRIWIVYSFLVWYDVFFEPRKEESSPRVQSDAEGQG